MEKEASIVFSQQLYPLSYFCMMTIMKNIYILHRKSRKALILNNKLFVYPEAYLKQCWEFCWFFFSKQFSYKSFCETINQALKQLPVCLVFFATSNHYFLQDCKSAENVKSKKSFQKLASYFSLSFSPFEYMKIHFKTSIKVRIHKKKKSASNEQELLKDDLLHINEMITSSVTLTSFFKINLDF